MGLTFALRYRVTIHYNLCSYRKRKGDTYRRLGLTRVTTKEVGVLNSRNRRVMERPGYVAVRKNVKTGREWVDVGTFASVQAVTERRTTDDIELLRQYYSENPVVRIVLADVTLVVEDISVPSHIALLTQQGGVQE